MVFYYSGAASAGTEQNEPTLSLGGYVSVATINNASLNAIFSTIGKSMVTGNKKDTRLIVLKNITPSTVYNVKLYVDNTVDDNHSNLVLAAVSPAIDNCGDPYFEQISTTDSLPFQATLASHNGIGNAIEIGTMASGDVVGIWVSRTVKSADFPQLNGATNGTSDAAIAALQSSIANPITQDNVNIVVSWDSTTTTTTTAAP